MYDFLRKSGVYVDWREPNVMRLAVAPLYIHLKILLDFIIYY